MKKLFSKTLAIAISLAMVVALGAGVYFTKNTKAATYLSSSGWAFEQGGVYASDQETGWGNVGYISKVNMATNGESITNWERGVRGTQTQTASADTGATIQIENNGWDRTWDTDPWRINPWSIQGMAKFKYMNQDHNYKVTFKAKANKKKYCYVAFSTVVDGHEMTPYDNVAGALTGDEQCIVLTATEQEFTYSFPNYVGGEELSVDFMLGAFGPADDGGSGIYAGAYDYAGNPLPQVTEEEKMWGGTVTISDVKVEDLNPEMPTQEHTTEPPLYTTKAPTPTVAPQPTKAPTPVVKTLAKTTGVKVKSVKKKTIKVTFKKVANAKSYEIKVGNKTYKATKNSKKIKNKKFKKGKKVKVKVRAIAAGYTSGAWSKTVKKKLTK